jgi:transcription termination factor NusB
MGLLDGVKKLRDGIGLLRDPKALLQSDVGKAAKEEVDAYVKQKLDEARALAGGLADETLQKAKNEAQLFLDVVEKRIDAKLAEIEALLEARLQREVYWKLVALRWTLLFVVLMAVVSLAYLTLERKFFGHG